MAKESPTLLDMVNAATADDLAQIDQKITSAEADLSQTVAKAEAEIASLKSLRRVIDIKINGKPARKKREAKASSPGEPAAGASGSNGQVLLIDRVMFVIKQHGPTFPAGIGRKLDVTEAAVNQAVTLGIRGGKKIKALADGRIALSAHTE